MRKRNKGKLNGTDYYIHGVRYIVTSHFIPSEKTLSERVKFCLEKDLTLSPANSIIKAEYVCPAAGKEA